MGLAGCNGDRGRTTEVHGLEGFIRAVQAVVVVASAQLPPGVTPPARNKYNVEKV